MDISDTLAPTSDQLDAVDLLSGPRTFVIERVSKGNDEQPVNIHLAEFPRPWRPGKSMRRVLVACWGADAATYVGRRVQLYCDPSVSFGGMAVGGTRIAALSHLDKPKNVPLLVSRGKSAMFTVKPLADAPAPTEARAGGITPEQLSELGRLLREAAITDKAAGLAYISSSIDREVSSTRELTAEEAAVVLRDLKAMNGPEPELPGVDQ